MSLETDSDKKSNSSKKNKDTSMLTTLFKALLLITISAIFLVIGGVIFFVYNIIKDAPPLNVIAIKPNNYTSIVYSDATGEELLRFVGNENREYVALNKIPLNLKNAFVALEDERFYIHEGIDLRSIGRAIHSNLTENTNQGASTITQQLIKNNITKLTSNDYRSKIQEQYLALVYERELQKDIHYGSKAAAKDYILELYLNTIGLHHGLHGVQTASQYYFGKDVTDLTLSESAVIASITQNPSRYSPKVNPENNRERQLIALRKMYSLGMITDRELLAAIDDDVYSRIVSNSESIEEESTLSYFSDQLIQSLSIDLQENLNISRAESYNYIYNGGLKIYSTQDFHIQEIMDTAFLDDSFFPGRDFEIDIQYSLQVKKSESNAIENFYRTTTVKNTDQIEPFVQSVKDELIGEHDEFISETIIPIPQPQAAMIIIDYKTGAVKAVVGGRGDKKVNRSLNRATNSERQPGSVFKVLASYAPALDLGYITAATLIEDAPFTYDNYSPRNWYSGYRGFSTVREGIRDSMNILAVKNMIDTGIDVSFEYLVRMGFTTLSTRQEHDGRILTDKVPSLALGGITTGVTQLEVTAAYGAIANGGNYIKPYFYTRVYDHNGEMLIDNTKNVPKRILKETTSYILTDMMKDVVSSAGTGNRARFRRINMPISGKTGTTTDTKDLTFVGYTPYYVAGIWLGFDQPKIMREDNGYHMALWSNIMERIHSDLPYADFEMPEGIVQVRICTSSSNIASRNCSSRSELFAEGTEPTIVCSGHRIPTQIYEPSIEIEVDYTQEETTNGYTEPFSDLVQEFTEPTSPVSELEDLLNTILGNEIENPTQNYAEIVPTPQSTPIITDTDIPVSEYFPTPQETSVPEIEPIVTPPPRPPTPIIDDPSGT